MQYYTDKQIIKASENDSIIGAMLRQLLYERDSYEKEIVALQQRIGELIIKTL